MENIGVVIKFRSVQVGDVKGRRFSDAWRRAGLCACAPANSRSSIFYSICYTRSVHQRQRSIHRCRNMSWDGSTASAEGERGVCRGGDIPSPDDRRSVGSLWAPQRGTANVFWPFFASRNALVERKMQSVAK